MYVCLCNHYREAEIAAAARAGIRDAEAAYCYLGSGPNCGRCLGRAQDVLDRERCDAECASFAPGLGLATP